MSHDALEFQPEIHYEVSQEDFWNILIVDDDKEVHAFSKLALIDFKFLDKKIQIFSAYNEDDAKHLLDHHDFSVVFLDVVMENNESGFILAQYIREKLHNKYIQIVIRTGEPNQYTEEKVFKDFDINAYCEKTLMTRDKLIAQLHSSLSHHNQLTSLLKKQAELSLSASTDYLTGVFNRSKMDTEITRLMSRSKRYQEYFGAIMLDIDFFKNINDSFGHQTGDTVLLKLVNLLQKNIRDSDILVRWGGEEFLILLPFLSIEQIVDKAESLRLLIEKENFHINQSVTCSFGVAAFAPNDTKEALFQRVDKALYKAKQNGRNRVEKED